MSRRPKVEMVWSKSKISHCYGLLTIEPPDGLIEQESEVNVPYPPDPPSLARSSFESEDWCLDRIVLSGESVCVYVADCWYGC